MQLTNRADLSFRSLKPRFMKTLSNQSCNVKASYFTSLKDFNSLGDLLFPAPNISLLHDCSRMWYRAIFIFAWIPSFETWILDLLVNIHLERV